MEYWKDAPIARKSNLIKQRPINRFHFSIRHFYLQQTPIPKRGTGFAEIKHFYLGRQT
jgi:hypothetical protein